MIKRYSQFVKDKINENLEDLSNKNISDFNDTVNDFDSTNIDIENPDYQFSDDESDSYVEDSYEDQNGEEEEEDDEYIGYKKMEELAEELGVELRDDGSLSYNGVEVHFYSETEKFHIDKMRFTTVEEVVNYLKNGDVGDTTDDVESNSIQIDDLDFENNIKESKRYRNTRFKNRW